MATNSTKDCDEVAKLWDELSRARREISGEMDEITETMKSFEAAASQLYDEAISSVRWKTRMELVIGGSLGVSIVAAAMSAYVMYWS